MEPLHDDLRRLVRVETIRTIRPIDGADAIEAAAVGGWTLVVKKDEFTPGDQCLYFEIDSQLPMADPRFAFLAPRGTRARGDGTIVHRLKTARLRGVYSQGLALPATDFPEILALAATTPDADLAWALGVDKYEPPIPSGMQIAGVFPTHLGRKTDSERTQNLTDVGRPWRRPGRGSRPRRSTGPQSATSVTATTSCTCAAATGS